MLTHYGYRYDNPSKPFKLWFKWDRNVGIANNLQSTIVL